MSPEGSAKLVQFGLEKGSKAFDFDLIGFDYSMKTFMGDDILRLNKDKNS